MDMSEKKIVLCGANAYTQKYYYNKEFSALPESIQEELHILCVLFTEDIGGIFTLCFDENGILQMETMSEPSDYSYDEIGRELMIRKISDKRSELFAQLELFYKAVFLGETIE